MTGMMDFVHSADHNPPHWLPNCVPMMKRLQTPEKSLNEVSQWDKIIMYMSRADSPGERVFHMRLAATKRTPSPKLERHTVCAFPEHNAGLTQYPHLTTSLNLRAGGSVSWACLFSKGQDQKSWGPRCSFLLCGWGNWNSLKLFPTEILEVRF